MNPPELPVWYFSPTNCSCSSSHTHDHGLPNNTAFHQRLFFESMYDPVRFPPYFHKPDVRTKDFTKIYSRDHLSLHGLPGDNEGNAPSSFSSFNLQQKAHIKIEKNHREEDVYDALPSSYTPPRYSASMGLCAFSSGKNHTGSGSCSAYSEDKARKKGRKRRRTTFTDKQLQSMEKEFDDQKYIGGLDRQYLADALGLTEKQVQVWFQNRRNKWRRESQA